MKNVAQKWKFVKKTNEKFFSFLPASDILYNVLVAALFEESNFNLQVIKTLILLECNNFQGTDGPIFLVNRLEIFY